MKFLILITKLALVIAMFTSLAYYQQWMFTLIFSGVYALYNTYNGLMTIYVCENNRFLMRNKRENDELLEHMLNNSGREFDA